MSNKALLTAIIVGLVILCVIVIVIAIQVVRTTENISMAQELTYYCTRRNMTAEQCQPWVTNMLQNHRDAVVACINSSSQYDCFATLSPRP